MTKADFIERAAIELVQKDHDVDGARMTPATAWKLAIALADARPASLGAWPTKRESTTSSSGGSKRSSGPLPTTLPNYGKAKGQAIRDASDDDLGYYARNAERSLNDDSKRRFHASEQAMLDAIRAEQARRADGHDDPPGNPLPPGPDDSDVAL